MTTTFEEKIEVSQYYVLGDTVEENHKKTGFSHGKVVGIIQDLVAGKLQIPGLPSQEVIILHALGIQLKKKNLTPVQAHLGVLFFMRCIELGIGMSQLDQWAELMKDLAPEGYPAVGFLQAALHLYALEKTEKLPFTELVNKFTDLVANKNKLEVEIHSLVQKKINLANAKASLESSLKELHVTESKLKTELADSQAELAKTKGLAYAEKSVQTNLSKENAALLNHKAELGSEIGGQEATLQALKQIGLSESHLLQIKNLFKDLANAMNNDVEEFKLAFFKALHDFGGLPGLKSAIESKQQHLKDLQMQSSTLVGEIASLEFQKAKLNGEVKESCVSAASLIAQSAEKASNAIDQYVGDVRTNLKALMDDTILTSVAVGQEMVIQKSAEQSTTELVHLIDEVKRRRDLRR
ncbi:MAG: hypothetical protein TUN42_01790 [Dehalogenimonas sp.]